MNVQATIGIVGLSRVHHILDADDSQVRSPVDIF
jgi:hypothetical protein